MISSVALGLVIQRIRFFPRLAAAFLVFWAIWAVAQTSSWKNEESLWRNAINNSPGSSVARNEWGIVQMKKQNYQEALQAFEEALRLQPRYREASLNQSVALYYAKDYEEADTRLRGHISSFGDDAQAYDLMSVVSEKLGKYEDSVEASKKAIELDPYQWKYMYNLGTTYFEHGEFKNALLIFQEIIDAFPSKALYVEQKHQQAKQVVEMMGDS